MGSGAALYFGACVMNVGNVFIDTSVLERITAEIRPRASKVVSQYGLLITGTAAKNAPVDTGRLRNSITASSKMIDDSTYRIQDGVHYGIFQELGTSKMAAQPFLIPALEMWRDKFLAAFSQVFK
jgi:HK97 gp10 family phage protein